MDWITPTDAENKRLLTYLFKQADDLLTTRSLLLGKHGSPDATLKKECKFLSNFFKTFITERNNRAQEVGSPTVQAAANIARSLFPYYTKGVFCVDGRIMQSVTFGFPASSGRFIRLPAGDLPGFRFTEDGELTVSENTEITKRISHHYKTYTQPLALILDSHLGCAARGSIEKNKGSEPQDGGLLEDVKRKKKISRALIEFVQNNYKKRDFLPIQFSFDPHNGFGCMGLETDEVLDYAETHQGYGQQTLDKLVQQSRIIATKALAQEYKLTFKKHAFQIDWEKEYADSAYRFWNSIQRLVTDETIVADIEKKVRTIYKNSTANETKQRALLLLSNAFNGYLQNQKGYPHHTHQETCVIIQEQGYGPFSVASFSVYPSIRLAVHTVFASLIVRANRSHKNIIDFTNTYGKDFPAAPVPVIIKSVVRNEYSPDVWIKIRNIDWNSMPEHWHQMIDEEFGDWVDEQYEGNIPRIFANAINEVRKIVTFLYTKDEDALLLLSEGKLALLPAIVDSNRRIQCILPFAHTGFKKNA